MKITKKQRKKIDSNVRLVWIRCLLQRYFLCRACRSRCTCRAIYSCRTGLTGWRRCFKPVHRSRCTWRSVYKLFRLCLLLFFGCLSKESHAVFHGTHPTSALTKFRALGIKRRSARLKCVSFKSKYCYSSLIKQLIVPLFFSGIVEPAKTRNDSPWKNQHSREALRKVRD